MGDTIDRQAAVDVVEFGITYAKKINKETGKVEVLFKQSNEELQKAIDRINALPSAEPTEEQVMDYCHRRCLVLVTSDLYSEMQRRWSAEPQRKKGKWIGLDDDAVMTDTVQCSVCRKQFTVDADRFYDIGFVIEDLRFCPNCGADMRGDMDEAD